MARPRVLVTVIVPTLRRPSSLARALASLADQGACAAALMEVVVVDNDAVPSAASVASAFAATAAFPVTYVHEPEPGVATARNAGVASAQGELIAFLDDDETAEPGWLAGLLDVQARFDADAVFGPVEAAIPASVTRHRPYFQRFFSRFGPVQSGPMQGYFGCGNSLVRVVALPDPDQPFSPERNRMGGEDDLLFGDMQSAGARFAWAAEARVLEHPDPARLTLGYTLRRAFAYGQGPSAAAASRRPARWTEVAFWMAVGAGQAVVFSLGGLLARGAGRSDWARILDRAAQGLGKLLWFGPFKIGFYGADAPGTAR